MKKMESTEKNITHGLLSRLVVIMAFLFAGAIGAFPDFVTQKCPFCN